MLYGLAYIAVLVLARKTLAVISGSTYFITTEVSRCASLKCVSWVLYKRKGILNHLMEVRKIDVPDQYYA